MNKKKTNRKGFTLIELLVVIAIIAVLSIVVILSLNPAELLRQARDSNRVSDLATLKSAISLYLADQSIPVLGTSTQCYIGVGNATATMYTPSQTGVWAATTTCAAWFASATSMTTSTSRSISGSGWIPVPFSNISAGTPIGQEPVDPVNTFGTAAAKSSGAFFYGYIMSGTTFKLSAFTESVKYSASGTNDVESTDGGNNNFVYEQGTALSL
jgi:prepilin-type N-terminal cleavage/methylation domain-containing protein